MFDPPAKYLTENKLFAQVDEASDESGRSGGRGAREPVSRKDKVPGTFISIRLIDTAPNAYRVSPTPYFALSWMLTLFSHDCNTFGPVQRIFDYLLGRNPALVIYLGVAVSHFGPAPLARVPS